MNKRNGFRFETAVGRRTERHGGIHDNRRAALSNFFLMVLATICLVFGLLNLVYFRFLALAAVELSVFAVVAIALLDLRCNRNIERTAWVTVLAFGGLALFFYGYIRAEFSASVWAVFFAMINFFLLGTRRAVPVYLAFSGAIVAMILLNRPEWPAVQTDAALSNIFGALLAFGAVGYYQERSRERAHDRIRELADSDSLTGAANRRHFVDRFAQIRHQSRASAATYSLLLADIDDFKRINDTYGHAVGDEVIATVCARIAAVVRDDDIVARLGGEEFGVLLVGCDGREAGRRAEMIRRAIAANPVSVAEYRVGVTVSIGVAEGDSRAQDFTALFAQADKRLYVAKTRGRDRVVADATAG